MFGAGFSSALFMIELLTRCDIFILTILFIVTGVWLINGIIEDKDETI